jgi:selenocysteine lyase/cysteine desulfurase
MVSPAENIALAKRLLDEFGIFTVHRTGVAAGACVRVTPGLCNRVDDVDALVPALRKLVAGV